MTSGCNQSGKELRLLEMLDLTRSSLLGDARNHIPFQEQADMVWLHCLTYPRAFCSPRHEPSGRATRA